MASVKRRSGGVRVGLSPDEAALLSSLSGQVATLLGSGEATAAGADPAAGEATAAGADTDAGADPLERMVGPTSSEPVAAPDDPALHRLLPDAYADDEPAGEFRRLMDAELRATKTAALQRLGADVADLPTSVQLTTEVAEMWLQALTDIRLVLGTRLDITEDVEARYRDLDPDDPRLPMLAMYDWLSWLQDALVQAVAGW